MRAPGLRGALGALVHRQFRMVEAVRSLSFSVEQGEVIGFLGPNGAGKTTTLKMLSGLLFPTSGTASVLGFVPWQRKGAYLRRIAMIRGSRPIGAPPELTVLDALRFQRLVYDLTEPVFRRSLAHLVELLGLEPLLQRQIRQLSLGERMRAGLAWSLVYRPRVLFMDEPTIGLDVSVADTMRGLIATYSEQTGAAIVLTSHDMVDVERLCRRVLLINEGKLVFDGDLAALTGRLAPYKILRVAVPGASAVRWERYGAAHFIGETGIELQVPRNDVPAVTARLLADLSVADLSVQDPPLESLIAAFYRQGSAA
jgi:ABC-2 type transport system ATP-binding protein